MIKETVISQVFKGVLLVITIAVLILIYLNGLSIISFNLSDNTIVLTFVGILATFIIINNHSQVEEVKDLFNEFEKKIKIQNEVIDSLLSNVDYDLYEIVNDIINKKHSEIEAYDIHMDSPDKYSVDDIKIKITIEQGRIICTNVATGKLADSVVMKHMKGIKNLDKDKLYSIYKFYTTK